MNIFVGITLAAVAALLVTAHSGILQDADAKGNTKVKELKEKIKEKPH